MPSTACWSASVTKRSWTFPGWGPLVYDSDGKLTERTLARAQSLLERYGVVSREVALAEDLPGGWGPVYRVLRSMEEAGRVRRGYFVEGLSGAQFVYKCRHGRRVRFNCFAGHPDPFPHPGEIQYVHHWVSFR